MTDKKSSESRRKLLKQIGVGSGAVITSKNLPDEWIKPVVDSVALPAHAQVSPDLPEPAIPPRPPAPPKAGLECGDTDIHSDENWWGIESLPGAQWGICEQGSCDFSAIEPVQFLPSVEETCTDGTLSSGEVNLSGSVTDEQPRRLTGMHSGELFCGGFLACNFTGTFTGIEIGPNIWRIRYRLWRTCCESRQSLT